MKKGTKMFQKIKEQKLKKNRIPTKTAKQKKCKKAKSGKYAISKKNGITGKKI